MIGLSAIVSGLLGASPAAALLLDFEEFGHGDTITSSQGVAITTTNDGGGPDLGVGFDSNRTGTRDQDLQRISPGISGGETGWKSGNLAPNTDLGIMLIIQENDWGCGDGNCDYPDDEGSRPAGAFEFDFSGVEGGIFTTLEFDFVDLESTSTEAGSVDFFLGLNSVGSISFMTLESINGVTFGDNSANTMPAIDVADLGSSNVFDRVVFNMGGSGALDNIITTPIPEPGAALLFAIGFGLTGAAVIRRRRA
jgi:hypothetical protein